MNRLQWRVSRLRAMSAAEILFRGGRWGSTLLERGALACGWAPRAAGAARAVATFFPPGSGWRDAWSQSLALDPDRLEQILRGEVEVFGSPMRHAIPADWHRDPLTGKQTPMKFGKAIDYRDDAAVGNIKVLWELGRHHHLVPVAVAYAVTGETRYRRYLATQIEGWIAANPYGFGVHWCSALEVALRLIAWAFLDSLLKLRGPEEGLLALCEDRLALSDSIYQHAWFVRGHLSRHSSANNHLLGELTGLFVGTTVFDLGGKGAQWRDQARAELVREASRQTHGDGVNKEQALYYHLWVLEYLLVAWLAAERGGTPFPMEFADRIVAMAQFIEALVPTGGDAPQIGDADDGFVTRFCAGWPTHPYADIVLAVGEVFGGAAPSPPAAAGRSDKAFWYGLAAGERATSNTCGLSNPARKPRYPRIFEQGGYAVLGDGDLHLVFDAGPLGYGSIAAHGHADALSICLAVGGDWWLVDPGTYAYHSAPEWREYFRGTKAHNTLLVDNRSQSASGGAFLWVRHANARIDARGAGGSGHWVAGSHNGYAGVHRREVRFDARTKSFRILDAIEGKGTSELRLHFHFHPRIVVRQERERGVWTLSRTGSPRKCRIEVDSRWQWEVRKGDTAPILGWYSSALHRKEPSPVLRGVWRGPLPARVETLLRVE